MTHQETTEKAAVTEKLRTFDAANYLSTAADQADLLNDAIREGDARYIAYALGSVARSRGGIAKLAKDTGLTRQALHKALSDKGNPTLATVLKVMSALGLELEAKPKLPEAA